MRVLAKECYGILFRNNSLPPGSLSAKSNEWILFVETRSIITTLFEHHARTYGVCNAHTSSTWLSNLKMKNIIMVIRQWSAHAFVFSFGHARNNATITIVNNFENPFRWYMIFDFCTVLFFSKLVGCNLQFAHHYSIKYLKIKNPASHSAWNSNRHPWLNLVLDEEKWRNPQFL